MADEELMRLLKSGSTLALEGVYDRHGGPAFSLAYRIVGDRGRAEEVTQEAFLSIWRSRRRYDPARGSVRTWVLGVVRNRAIDALRREGRHERRRGPALHEASADETLPAVEAPERTEVEAARRLEARTVRDALEALPDDQRLAIELAYFGGLSQSEIGTALQVPLGTVKGRMRLGLNKLRGRLEDLVEGSHD